MSYTPDLTGIDPNYYVTTYQRSIFRYSQQIVFDVPVFQNSNLVLQRLGTLPAVLVFGVDFTVANADIDYDSMSQCMTINPAFNATLLKSITMLIPTPSSPFVVQGKFNQLYMSSITDALINQNTTIEVTPDLIANLVSEVAYLQQMVSNGEFHYTTQSSITKLALDADPTDTNSNNAIVNEAHDINTTSNISLISPIYGPFFKLRGIIYFLRLERM